MLFSRQVIYSITHLDNVALRVLSFGTHSLTSQTYSFTFFEAASSPPLASRISISRSPTPSPRSSLSASSCSPPKSDGDTRGDTNKAALKVGSLCDIKLSHWQCVQLGIAWKCFYLSPSVFTGCVLDALPYYNFTKYELSALSKPGKADPFSHFSYR